MSDQRCAKCGGTLYSDPKYGCTSLSCSRVLPDFHFDLTKPTQSTDTDTADYTPQQDDPASMTVKCRDVTTWMDGGYKRCEPETPARLSQQDVKAEIDFVPWLIGTDDAPAPLPTDEQIAILLKENEELRERLKEAKTVVECDGWPRLSPATMEAFHQAAAAMRFSPATMEALKDAAAMMKPLIG